MERSKKECILQAASRAFTRFGFKKASVEDIAKDAGVAKGTVYLACDSKEDLFYQSLHREIRSWSAELARMIDPRTPADELLETVVRASIAYLSARPLLVDLFTGEHKSVMPNWVDRLEDLRELGRGNISEILKLGIKQGRFRSDLDIEMAASLLQDLHLASHIFHASDAADPARLERRMKAGLQLVLNGLRPIAPPAPATVAATN